MGLFSPASILTLVDEHGFESLMDGRGFPVFLHATLGPAESYAGMEIAAFPRRGKSFKLRLYSKGADEKLSFLGEITVPNPARKTYPAWTPSPMPVAKSDGDLEFSLVNLVTGVSGYGDTLRPAGRNEEVHTKTFFRVTQAGRRCAEWQVDNLELWDATENRLKPSAWRAFDTAPGEPCFDFRSSLSPDETAWKLIVTFKRKPEAKFEPAELWMLSDLSLPAIDSTNSVNLKTNLNGVKVELAALMDESKRGMSDDTRGAYRRIRLEIKVSSRPANMRFDVLSVTEGPATADSLLLGTEGFSQSYLVRAVAHTLSVKMAVYRQKSFEYIVKPTVPSRVAPPVP